MFIVVVLTMEKVPGLLIACQLQLISIFYSSGGNILENFLLNLGARFQNDRIS